MLPQETKPVGMEASRLRSRDAGLPPDTAAVPLRGISPALQGRRYTRVAVVLHWSIAALIAVNLLAFIYADHDFHPPLRRLLMPMHVSAGLTVLFLTVIRIMWRLAHVPPAQRIGTRWEGALATAAHFLLYCAMVLMPLTGWMVISAHPPSGSPGQKWKFTVGAAQAEAAGRRLVLMRKVPDLWWTVPTPMIGVLRDVGSTPGGAAAQVAMHAELTTWHRIGAYLTVALLLLHVMGALKHEWVDREPMLMRMTIARRRIRSPR